MTFLRSSFGLMLLIGCTHAAHPSLSKLRTLSPSVRQQVLEHCPEKHAKLKQHLLLRVRGQSFEMNGFLLLSQPENYYAVAYAEAPAPVFAFRRMNRVNHALTLPDGFPQKVITEGVMEDLKLAFLEGQPPQWVSGPSSSVNTLWHFGPDEELISKISFGNYRQINGCARPGIMTIENYQFPYTLNVTLLDYSAEVSEDTIHKAFLP